MKLRDYQNECISILESPLKKQLIQLPTGSGKTFIFLNYLRKNSQRALIVVPTLELKKQVEESALNLYHVSEIFSRKRNSDYKSSKLMVIVAASLNSSIFRDFCIHQKYDHIIFDEAHRALSKTYTDFLEFYNQFHNAYKLIGFTATPERLDKKSLLKIFEKLTYKKSLYELIKEGYLCDLKCFRITTKNEIITDGKTGDFKNIEIKHLDNYSRNKLIYDAYLENCVGKKTIIFCIDVAHSEKLADYLRGEKGIRSHHISGYQSFSHRKEILQKFKSGEIQVITNCQLLTEGFDEPSIESIIIARPTRSRSLYCQMIGRGSRLFPGKEICEVYELTDNAHKICTFNVAADEEKDNNFNRDYRRGITLTELHEEIKGISLSSYILQKQEVKIFNRFEDFIKSKGVSLELKKKLAESNIEYYEPIDSIEANFLIFLYKLKEKYGLHKS